MKTSKQTTGEWGEQQAVQFLRELGYEVIDRNYRIRKGELDIIAWHEKNLFGNTLCFVEVKTRGENDGTAERATGKEKLERMFRTARMYCLEKNINIENTPIQFEQVSVYGDEKSGSQFRHYTIPVE